MERHLAYPASTNKLTTGLPTTKVYVHSLLTRFQLVANLLLAGFSTRVIFRLGAEHASRMVYHRHLGLQWKPL
jgi:hypothetical protein